MMRKLSLLIACFAVCMGLVAQDKKVAISSATTSSYHNGNGADKAIDGEISTIWHSGNNGDGYNTTFPVTFTITFGEANHVDYVRYVPRTDGSNGHWDEVEVFYSSTTDGADFTSVGIYYLQGAGSSMDFPIEKTCRRVMFEIKSGNGGWASAAEIEAYVYNTEKPAAFAKYFTDELYTELKPNVTSSDDIADTDVKALVDAMLDDEDDYKKFRVGEYKAYMTLETLKQKLGVNSYYSAYENPTGIYLKKGESCIVAVSGIGEEPVKLKMKNWLLDEQSSSYKLRNGLNYITAQTEGNLFVDYYTDEYKNAPKVRMHFINAPVRGYWDQETMTADDWTKILSNLPENDSTILVVQSKHVEVAYPVFSWKQHCPEPAQVDSLMKIYQQILWAERDMLGVEKYKIEYPNRQFSYVVKEFSGGAMAAGGDGTLTPVYSMAGVMSPNGADLWVWGIAHEFGHTNQINPGFRWSGCIETTNNIYSSWAELHVNNGSGYLRLEDEVMTGGEFKMRGGRMQAYFEEALRKKNPWMLHEGQDFYNDTPRTEVVDGIDAEGNSIGKVSVTKRNYDHFVKLVPFWQLNLWGTKANRCPDIIPMTVQGIRTQRSTSDFSTIYNTAGKEQINWMRLACDSAKINLLPFFEKAGMLRPIHTHIDSWNIITEAMIADLKTYVADKRYPTPAEEINYINGHNYHIYRDKLKLNVASMQGTLNGDKVKILHSVAQNAVAFETYNIYDELVRITMYGLGSDDAHSFTQVLFPQSAIIEENAAYIMAVGYDGTRKKVYEKYTNEVDMVRETLNCLITEVEDFLKHYIDNTGKKVGYYKEESLGELKSVLTQAKDILNREVTTSFTDMHEALMQAYTDLKKNESARNNIVSGHMYYLGSKRATGKSMSIDANNAVISETNNTQTNKQEWLFENTGESDVYYIKNVNTGKYLGTLVDGAQISATAEKTSAAGYKVIEINTGLWALQCQKGDKKSLHNTNDNKVIGYGHDEGSYWYITSTGNVDKDIEAKYNVQVLIEKTEALIAEVGTVKNKALDLQESNYYSNAECKDASYGDQFTSYSVLCDNDPATFFHSDYSGQAPDEDHYIRIDVGNSDSLKLFDLFYRTRNQGGYNLIAPTKVVIEASNDAKSWIKLREITSGLPEEANASYTIKDLGDGTAYRYVRMVVNETTQPDRKAGNHCFFAVSEFGLSRMTEIINPAYAEITPGVLTEVFNVVVAAKIELATATTAEEYTAIYAKVQVQYDALLAARDAAVGFIPVSAVTLDKTTASLVEGETLTLVATVTPAEATDKTVTWNSSNAAVAAVDVTGKVTAVAAGKATITAKAGEKTATCEVTVEKKVIPVEGISLNRTSAALVEGESLALVATVTPEDATDKTVTWTTSDASVATVDATGKVTAVAVGTATITAQAGDFFAACEVTVDRKVIDVEGVELDVTSVELTRGDSLTIHATVFPEDATDKTVAWSSSNEAVACVNSDGTVVALSAGTAIITATSNGYEASCVVVVNEVNGIDLLLMDGSWPVDIYDVTGRIVRKNAYSITDLEEGFYFINGRKYFINK